jgi:hypothetical protein
VWCLQGNVRKERRGDGEEYYLEPTRQNAILYFPVQVLSGTAEFEVAFSQKPGSQETFIIGFSDHAWGDVLSFFVSDGKLKTIAKGKDNHVMETVTDFDFTGRNVLSIRRGGGSCTFLINGDHAAEYDDSHPNKPLYVGVIAEKGDWKNGLHVTRANWSPGL